MRNIKKKFILISLIITSMFNILIAKKTVLNNVYQKWINEVHYIITKTERDVFYKLTTNNERDIFIKAFWKHRDFTINTPENEYKDEHYRRLSYVKKKYGRGMKIGWQTDRGKVYIILGKPISIQRHSGFSTVKECEIWNYQLKPKAGIPPIFNIVFFDKTKTGEFTLYSPINDGPQSLLLNYQGSPGKTNDTFNAYMKIKEYNSFLANTAISLIPGGESSIGQPSMSSEFLLRNIDQAPKKNVDDLYAKKFINYKGIVSVNYSINYIRNKSTSFIIRNENGINFLHYFIKLNTLSLDQYDNKYYTKIEIYGNLKNLKGKNIYKFKKNYNISLNTQEFEEIEKRTFAISDYFPIKPGKYKLSIMLKNTNSKEFTAYDTNIDVKPKNNIYMSKPILAYKIEKNTNEKNMKSFMTKKGSLLLEPENIFTKKNNIYTFFQLYNISDNLRKYGKILIEFKGDKSYSKKIVKNMRDYKLDEKDFLFTTNLSDFAIDYYKILISIIDKNEKTVLSKKSSFYITPLKNISRSKTYTKASSLNQKSITAYRLAIQYYNSNKPLEALPLMKKAYFANPRIKQFAIGLSDIYFKLKKYNKIEQLLKPFINSEKPDYQIFITLGKVNKKMKNWKNAIIYYRKVMSYHGLTANVLNNMASCYYNLKNIAEAKKAWKKSLEIDPKQTKVKKILKSLK